MIPELFISQVTSGARPASVLDHWLSEQKLDPEIMQSFLMQDQLNPVVWTSAGSMKPDVRKKLLSIAESFFNELDLDQYVLDDITVNSQ